ncbi:hypothetical protein Rsub_05249 [Raphidocelis subcapitata]|uniref:CDT1 Geminin-binding domain-containing protein n=1 Tax=Raphidocelis subcapitata TaxID=307507 RepID=A0A2V0P6C3_9CHLO|nr:hypothetical protein Rsub_05249 [Raphidocelis subcapitata]|eukprot:GBF92635.1 hypothetical protein Rsub_05249 [Raphidocelis subcapitata]
MEDVVVAEFASPFKRRKAALADHGKEPACFSSPPAPARKTLGRFFTPQGKGKPAGGPAAPATPGGEPRAATESRGRDIFCPDGPAAEEGLLVPEPEPLPQQLALLRELLGAIYVTLPLVKARGQLATHANLRVPVQNLCSRNLTVAHLQQIKALYPDAFTWQHVLAPAGRNGRQEEQLLLGLTPPERLASAQKQQQQEREAAAAAAAQQQQQQQQHATPSRRATRTAARGTPSKASPAPSPAKRAGSAGLLSPAGARPAAIGASASLQGTQQQQKEFLKALQAFAASAGGKGGDAELALAQLPPPAPASVRDATPSRRLGSAGSGSGLGGAGGEALPRTPQTGASGRVAASPIGTPADPGTPATDATVRTLDFSPVPGSKQPVPRFDAPAAGATTPGGTKRNALGLSLPRPSPRGAGGGDGLLSPRGHGRDGAALRPSRLCFDSLAPPASAAAAMAAPAEAPEQQPAPAKPAAPRVRRLSFDAPAAAGPREGGGGGEPAAAVEEGQVQLAREGSGSGRQLSGGLQFELKASTMALLDRAASAQVRVEQARQAAELDARHHLDLAPGTFEVLRCIFGNKGPCALPHQKVVSEIRSRSTSKTGLSPADADAQLRAMLRLLPAWIRLDHPAGVALADMRVVVRIHRRTPWGDLRRQLLERIAAARLEAVPVAGKDAEAAAAAEAADLARAALDAAVERAQAAAAAQAGSTSGSSGGSGAVAGGDEGSGEAATGAAAEEGEEGERAEDAAAAGRLDRDQAPSGGGEQRRAAGEGGKVPPEALAACLKARVWGRQGGSA